MCLPWQKNAMKPSQKYVHGSAKFYWIVCILEGVQQNMNRYSHPFPHPCTEFHQSIDNISPFEREVLALDLLKAVSDELHGVAAGVEADEEILFRLNMFHTPSMVKSILNVFVSSWDRSRRVASDILLHFPVVKTI